MKKIAYILFLISTIYVGKAQTGFHAGLNLGYNSSWILNQNNYGLSELDYELSFGVYPGLALGYNFNENSGVQLELNYAQMGQDYFDVVRDFGPEDGSGKSEKVDTYRYVDLNYFQIPILYRFQTTRDKKQTISFHAMAGPSIGLLLSADQYYEADVANNGTLVQLDYELAPESLISDFSATTDVEEPIEYFSSLDLGIQLDLGVDIYFNDNLYLTPSLKMYYGFLDINSEPTRDVNGYGASNNAFVGINVGIHYMMAEKKKN